MAEKLGKCLKNIIYPFAAAALFILAWYFAAKAAGNKLILPLPDSAFDSFFKLVAGPDFWLPFGGTVLRSFYSFLLSLACALALAVAGGIFNPLHRLLSPLILILRSTPTISVILLLLIWAPEGTAPMIIAFLIVFPSMYAAVYGAVISADKEILEMSKVYRVKKSDIALKFYLPGILPALFVSMKSNISLNLKIIIASEVLAQTKNSMGLMMQRSGIYLDTASLMAWTIAAVIAGFLLELLVEGVKRITVRQP